MCCKGKPRNRSSGYWRRCSARAWKCGLSTPRNRGANFRAGFDRYPRLAKMLEQVMCPRVHFKIIVIDHTVCYVGSANLTGADMGMKSPHRRNFEAGILTDEPAIVATAIEESDKVWRECECEKCQRVPTFFLPQNYFLFKNSTIRPGGGGYAAKIQNKIITGGKSILSNCIVTIALSIHRRIQGYD